MNDMPLVSVIIPCYNYGRYLRQALDSISNQSYSRWECIIVDDGSTDNTSVISREYSSIDPRFKYVFQENQGHFAARNKGLKTAAGPLIQFLDADDKLQREKLKSHASFLTANPEIDIVYGNIEWFDESANPSPTVLPGFYKKPRVSGTGEAIIENLLDDNFFLPGCTMFRKRIFEAVGGLKASYGFEDWEFWHRVAVAGFSFSHYAPPGSLLLARNHENNTSKKYQAMMESKMNVRKEIIDETKRFLKTNNTPLSRPYLKELIKKHQHMLGIDKAFYNLRFGNIFSGIQALVTHALPSGKPYFAFYESYHMVKARMKERHQKAL